MDYKELKALINEEIKAVLKDEFIHIKSDSSIMNYGINSFLFINIIVQLENKLNIEFPEEKLSFDQMDSVDSIIKVINQIL